MMQIIGRVTGYLIASAFCLVLLAVTVAGVWWVLDHLYHWAI